MRPIRHLPVALALALLLSPGSAWAVQWLDPDSETTTGVSGSRGIGSFELKATPAQPDPSANIDFVSVGWAHMHAVAGFWWQEEGDRPCAAGVYLRNIETGDASAGEGAHVCESQGLPTTNADIPIVGSVIGVWAAIMGRNGADRAVFLQAPRRFVRGVQICRNPGNERLKGVRLYMAQVGYGARTITNVSGRREEKMPNCGSDEWANTVRCGSNRVARSVIVHYDRTNVGNRRKITGLQLTCYRF